jgi:hypothetical protein
MPLSTASTLSRPTGRPESNKNAHRDDANSLHKEKSESNSDHKICLFQQHVDQALADPCHKYRSGEAIEDWTGEAGGKQSHHHCDIDRKRL